MAVPADLVPTLSVKVGGVFWGQCLVLPVKVLFTRSSIKDIHPWEGRPYIEKMRELFSLGQNLSGAELVDSPEEADLIILFETNKFKGREYARLLMGEHTVTTYPEKCFVFNYDVYPVGFLPGVYVSMPMTRMDYGRFHAHGYMRDTNPWVAKLAVQRDQQRPGHLFSFRGTETATVRGRIFEQAEKFGPGSLIVRSDPKLFFKHDADSQRQYVEEMLDSKFVLCPRGLTPTTYRLFETMELGRVPVILSDDWVPPQGPHWLDFTIRLAECRVAELAEILRSYEDRAEVMGQAARKNWEEWFAPEVRVHRLIQYIWDLKLRRTRDEQSYHKEWFTWKFYEKYDLSPIQGVKRRLKQVIQGKLLGKV